MGESDGVVLRDVRVFDGRTLLDGVRAVRVRDGRVAELGADLAVDDRDEVVDGHGATLLPGLIDSHTHAFDGSLEQALAFGVTTELDMHCDPAVASRLREAAAHRDDLADLRSAGTGATAPGGHPTHLVERGIYPPFPTITGPAEAEEFVAARAGEGSDYLKLFVDDGRSVGYPRPTLDAPTVAALVAAAHRRNLLVVAHPSTRRDVVTVVDAGVDGLAHLPTDQPLGDELTARIADGGQFVVPTVGVSDAVCGCGAGPELAARPDIAPYLDPFSTTMLTLMGGNFPLGPDTDLDPTAVRRSIPGLVARGVRLLAGTDAGTLGVAHGASLHHELAQLVGAGVPPVDALRAATAGPAEVFGLPDRGRIASGYRADLLLVDGDPTTDVTTTTRIVAIWRRGVRVDRSATA